MLGPASVTSPERMLCPPKFLQSCQARSPFQNLSYGGWGEGRAHTLLPEPPKDGTFADSGRLQPVLKRQGGSIEHRLARSRGRGDAGLLGLAVLEAVSARVMLAFRPAATNAESTVGGNS
jgi:hypothetical protein